MQIRASNDHPVIRHCMQISYVLFIRVRRLTKAAIFHMPQKKVEKPGLQINGTIIEYVNTFNFLGITINNHLNSDSHINKVANKVSKIAGILNKLKHFYHSIFYGQCTT